MERCLMRYALIVLLTCGWGCGDPAAPVQSQETASIQSEEDAALAETTVGNVRLKPTSVLDGKLSLLTPQEFAPMDEELLRLKYPSERRPKLVLSNERGTVNIAINHTQDRMRQGQLAEAHQLLETVYKNGVSVGEVV